MNERSSSGMNPRHNTLVGKGTRDGSLAALDNVCWTAQKRFSQTPLPTQALSIGEQQVDLPTLFNSTFVDIMTERFSVTGFDPRTINSVGGDNLNQSRKAKSWSNAVNIILQNNQPEKQKPRQLSILSGLRVSSRQGVLRTAPHKTPTSRSTMESDSHSLAPLGVNSSETPLGRLHSQSLSRVTRLHEFCVLH